MRSERLTTAALADELSVFIIFGNGSAVLGLLLTAGATRQGSAQPCTQTDPERALRHQVADAPGTAHLRPKKHARCSGHFLP